MTLHLIKLSVGTDSVADMKSWQSQRLKHLKAQGEKAELIHVTRHMPRRAEEILNGGSIYWVIKGFVLGRQKIIDLRCVKKNGIDHCGIVYDKKFVTVRSQPKKAFQGWRYFDAKDAPPDAQGDYDEDLPETLKRELRELGLL